MNLEKKSLSILTILVYSTLIFRSVVPLIDYVVNYNYIVTELCLQKDNQNSDCNGTCYLSQQIQNQTESASNNHNTIVVDFTKVPHFITEGISIKHLNNLNKIISFSINFNGNIFTEPKTPPPKTKFFL